ncbi:OLC1v1007321C1 [Oldenlandia corymbosa var. corymbosa]|uniref:OLC1v1007321C1 n=1 Tax=Oldenlandia corymbosa var. corymbosa TaxID=529605 RepID=A0AAV1DKH4_OLDCO|nr:OLC1v1007321C1 [Oldenlandia corymbosa var. corymbosa]
MATSVESSSSPLAVSLGKESETLMGSPSQFSPSSDKRFWSNLRSRVDSLLENRKPTPFPNVQKEGANEGVKRLKEDSMLLLRGFDSVAHTLSQLSNNLENALQGATQLANAPTLTEILQCKLEGARKDERKPNKGNEDEATEEENHEEGKRGQKRKLDAEECCDEDQTEEDLLKKNTKSSKELGKLNKAKNIAISMATKAGTLARELKSIKSDLCFMQERCSLLEEENRRLRDGIAKGIRPEEDDLVRLQLEALLAEKSRLANENANLTRENRCLHQLVEYHQLTTQDLSASYENLITGMCLDFSSPTTPAAEEEDKENCGEDVDDYAENPRRPKRVLGLSKSLDECYDEL